MRLQVPPDTPQFFAAVVRVVSRYPPFGAYRFGQMTEALAAQLRDGTCVVAIDEGRIVGYLGWVRTTRESAERWMQGEGPLASTATAGADAVVATILVAPDRRTILPMIRMLSALNPGRPVYRKRSFQDGRPEAKRPPISGRSGRRKTAH